MLQVSAAEMRKVKAQMQKVTNLEAGVTDAGHGAPASDVMRAFTLLAEAKMGAVTDWLGTTLVGHGSEVGGKVLIGGQEPACDVPEYVPDPDACREALSDNWTSLVYRAALRMPGLRVPNTAQGIVAMYDVTEDWMPVYDKSALEGYFMAIGTSGNQFKNAGVAGRLMRELIEASEGGRDLDASPLQFRLQRVPGEHTIDTATFSRRRPRLATSGSVMG